MRISRRPSYGPAFPASGIRYTRIEDVMMVRLTVGRKTTYIRGAVVSLRGQPPHDSDAEPPQSLQLLDPLTGLLTRDGLIAAASDQVRPGAAAIFLDFDNFRRINAAHGRSAGNVVLADL